MRRWLLLVLVVGIGAAGCEDKGGVQGIGDDGQEDEVWVFDNSTNVKSSADSIFYYLKKSIGSMSGLSGLYESEYAVYCSDMYSACLADSFEYLLSINDSVTQTMNAVVEEGGVSGLFANIVSRGLDSWATFYSAGSRAIDDSTTCYTFRMMIVLCTSDDSLPLRANNDHDIYITRYQSGVYGISKWVEYGITVSGKHAVSTDETAPVSGAYDDVNWYDLKRLY